MRRRKTPQAARVGAGALNGRGIEFERRDVLLFEQSAFAANVRPEIIGIDAIRLLALGANASHSALTASAVVAHGSFVPDALAAEASRMSPSGCCRTPAASPADRIRECPRAARYRATIRADDAPAKSDSPSPAVSSGTPPAQTTNGTFCNASAIRADGGIAKTGFRARDDQHIDLAIEHRGHRRIHVIRRAGIFSGRILRRTSRLAEIAGHRVEDDAPRDAPMGRRSPRSRARRRRFETPRQVG